MLWGAGHRAFGFGAHRAVDDRLRIEFVGNGFGVGGDALVALAFKLGLIGAHADIELSAVLDAEARGFSDDQRGPPFGERAGLQCRQGVGHLVNQSLGETEMAVAAVGRVVTRQGDLAGQTLAAFGGGYALGFFAGATLQIERCGQPRLPGGRDSLDVFELSDIVDQGRLVGIRVDIR
jgi:hypothetical protein